MAKPTIEKNGYALIPNMFTRDEVAWLKAEGTNSAKPVVCAERRKNSMAEHWNYLPFQDHDGKINPMLSEAFLLRICELAGAGLTARRAPFFKRSLCPTSKQAASDISQSWHRDRDRGQLTAIVLLSDMNVDTAHTELIPELIGLSAGYDPRNTIIGRVALLVKRLLQRRRILEASAGDVLLLQTNRIIHRVVVPRGGATRDAAFLSFSLGLKVPVSDDEKYHSADILGAELGQMQTSMLSKILK